MEPNITATVSSGLDGPCRNWNDGACPCSGGACRCMPGLTHGHDRNLCGCWPEPPAPKAARRACRCGAYLTAWQLKHGLQCGACTRRDEALAGVGL